MSITALIVGSSPVRLWGLPSNVRIERQLRAIGIASVFDDVDALPAGGTVLAVHAGYLFELRTLRGLRERPGNVLRCDDDDAIAAAHLDTAAVPEIADTLAAPNARAPAGVAVLRPEALDNFDGDLRRAEAPLLRRIDERNGPALEDLLYGNSYKGITDLVTKWLWPKPAKHIVRACAQLGITPNAVTSFGLGLVIAASLLFLEGHFAAGLACGWLMTLLDTVDGKLARVTVSSSRIGHVLDHGMDIVHPPFWYVMWGMGLVVYEPVFGLARETLYWLIVGGYVGGRAIEALFHGLADCSMFAWRPADAYFRLVTARRNPCLILMTAAVMLGRPDWGLLGTALWTAFSTFAMFFRLLYAAAIRLRSGRLESWLQDPGTAATRYPAAFRTFSGTRAAYG